MHWYDDTWWTHMGWMMILWLIGGILLVALVVWVLRSMGPGGAGRPFGGTGPEGAEEILRRRYARGEIDEQEYHRRLEELRAG